MEKIKRWDIEKANNADCNCEMQMDCYGMYVHLIDHEQALQKEREERIEFLETQKNIFKESCLLESRCERIINNFNAEISRLKGLK